MHNGNNNNNIIYYNSIVVVAGSVAWRGKLIVYRPGCRNVFFQTITNRVVPKTRTSSFIIEFIYSDCRFIDTITYCTTPYYIMCGVCPVFRKVSTI